MEKETAFSFTFVYISNSTIWAVLFQIWRINFQVRMIYNNVMVKDLQDLFPKTLNSLNYLNRVNLHPWPSKAQRTARITEVSVCMAVSVTSSNCNHLRLSHGTARHSKFYVNKRWSGSILEDSGSLTNNMYLMNFPCPKARPESSHPETKPNLIFILQDKWLVVFKSERQKKA